MLSTAPGPRRSGGSLIQRSGHTSTHRSAGSTPRSWPRCSLARSSWPRPRFPPSSAAAGRRGVPPLGQSGFTVDRSTACGTPLLGGARRRAVAISERSSRSSVEPTGVRSSRGEPPSREREQAGANLVPAHLCDRRRRHHRDHQPLISQSSSSALSRSRGMRGLRVPPTPSTGTTADVEPDHAKVGGLVEGHPDAKSDHSGCGEDGHRA